MENFLKSFTFKKYNKHNEIKTGDILCLKNGKIYLVGDVNELLGVCDDCTEFSKNDIDSIAHIYEKGI